MNKIAFFYGAETSRLRKIMRKTRNKDLCRRANAVLLVLKGKIKSEVARLLQAGRSSVGRWITWYEVGGVDGCDFYKKSCSIYNGDHTAQSLDIALTDPIFSKVLRPLGKQFFDRIDVLFCFKLFEPKPAGMTQ